MRRFISVLAMMAMMAAMMAVMAMPAFAIPRYVIKDAWPKSLPSVAIDAQSGTNLEASIVSRGLIRNPL